MVGRPVVADTTAVAAVPATVTTKSADPSTSDDGALLLPPGTARRPGARELAVVAAIAVCHCAGTQATQVLMRAALSPSAFFTMWFGTGWNVLLALPLLSHSQRQKLAESPATPGSSFAAASLGHALLIVLPFYGLWVGANTMYIGAIAMQMDASLVAAIFAVTPALVAVLSVPVLHRPLSPLAVLAVGSSMGGVVLIAQPWATDHSPPPPPLAPPSAAAAAESPPSQQLLATLCVLGAAACAATYKVAFRKAFGEAHPLFVVKVLALLGVWSLTAGSALLPLEGGVQREAVMSAAEWGWLSLKASLDLGFNFFIAFGLSITHPLFVSIGTLLSTPLNVLAQWALYASLPGPTEWAGIAAILAGFGLLLLDEAGAQKDKEREARARAGPATQAPPVPHGVS